MTLDILTIDDFNLMDGRTSVRSLALTVNFATDFSEKTPEKLKTGKVFCLRVH
jgi:hypothetical protein